MSLPDGSIKRSTEIKTVVFRMLASLPSGVGVSGDGGSRSAGFTTDTYAMNPKRTG
jgi:hypothetical protein